MPKYTIKGEGDITLNDRDFVAQGGEKKVYRKGDVGFAIYEPASKMIPVAKIQELAVLDDPRIIRPDKILMQGKQIVGHTMRFVDNTTPVIQLFTKAFRQRNQITPEMMVKLVKVLQGLVSFVHGKGVLIVDLNELNWLANQTFTDLFGIDVNSYQTANFPATALMDSVRDRHMKPGEFSQETDWFSFGIIAFQMLIGIHPYKGKHPDYDHMSLDDKINARMTKNVSVFDPKAVVPKVCYPLDAIPTGLRQWMEAVFQNGLRAAPPSDYDALVQLISHLKEVVGANLFEIVELGTYDSDIVSYCKNFGTQVVCTEQSVYVDGRAQKWSKLPKIGFTPKMNVPVGLTLDNQGLVNVVNLRTGAKIDLPLRADDAMSCDGRLYLRQDTSVLEVVFTELGNNILASTKTAARVLDVPEATKIFENVIIQNLLGRWHISVFPESGKCYQVAIPDLDDYRVIDAKFDNKVLMVVGEKNGQYDRFVFRLNDAYNKYDVRKVENITYTGLNFTVAEHGACVCINEDEKVELFSNKIGSAQVKIMDDPAVDSAWKMFHEGTTVLFAHGSKLYKISMKSK
jgi:hypothetical protein